MSDAGSPKTFFVQFERKEDGDIEACEISIDLPSSRDQASAAEIPEEPVSTAEIPKSDFEEVLNTFRSAMDGYRNFIPLTLNFAPQLAYQMGFKSIESVAEHNGKRLEEHCKENLDVFELDIQHYRACAEARDRMEVSVEGAKHLPEVMLIGLVSVYDAMLGRLLRAVFDKHEEIVLTSEKSIKFSDLMKYASVEQARAALIDKEIDAVLRDSHHEQFDWMQKKFDIKLKIDLLIWPTFIEVCERRNLLTHTGGVVSSQYLNGAEENKFDVSGVILGQRLRVPPKYYKAAVNAVYEVGAKLCHVLWRKFAEGEREKADQKLNELGMALINDRSYVLAERILQFGVSLKKHHNDVVRRMMVVNLANAVRLQKRQADANAILQREDWSAVEDRFKLCVAAVRGEEDEVIRLMRSLGASGPIKAEDYRSWPVFRGLRISDKFSAAFQELFGSRLLIPKSATAEKISKQAPEESLASSEKEDSAEENLLTDEDGNSANNSDNSI